MNSSLPLLRLLKREPLLGALRGASLLFLRTVCPALLFNFRPDLFEKGDVGKAFWGLLLVVWLAILFLAENIRLAAAEERLMMFRQILVSLRKLAQERTTTLMEATEAGVEAQLAQAFDHDALMSEIVGSVFSIISRGNQDLEKHFRVTFMELEGDALFIRYYANSDNEIPRTMVANHGFAKGDGVAGRAWSTEQIVIVPNVERDMSKGGGIFVAKTSQHSQFKIKSIVSIPVSLLAGHAHVERFVGVLNIDSDQTGYFSDSGDSRQTLEIVTRPYTRLIALLYAVRRHQIGTG